MKKTICLVFMLSVFAVVLRPSLAMGQFFFLENENVGKPVKDFTLKTVGGAPVSLTDFRQSGKTVIFFWATWCPHCRRELTELNKNKALWDQKGIKVALVLSVTGAIVAEFVAANEGLGYLILQANYSLDTALALVILLILAFLSLALFMGVEILQRKMIPWSAEVRQIEGSF